MTAVVTLATANVAGELSLLCAEHACYERAPFDAAGHAVRLAEALSTQPPKLYAWIARLDGVAVGYAVATVDFSTWSARSFTHMDCLFVRHGYRGGGIGVQLLAAVAQFASAQGHAEIQWQTPDWNEDAARFYRREGAHAAEKLRFTLPLAAARSRS